VRVICGQALSLSRPTDNTRRHGRSGGRFAQTTDRVTAAALDRCSLVVCRPVRPPWHGAARNLAARL